MRWNSHFVANILPIDDSEPLTGYFLVWLVLGFGGKAFPVLYVRVALVSPS